AHGDFGAAASEAEIRLAQHLKGDGKTFGEE
ncbi:hypothetical protein A2U01_0081984, partial [Trifolium medium]|nr:hypothetical protein [Trifolium medium]